MHVLTLLLLEYNGKNAIPVQTPQNGTSVQGQHCLFTGISMIFQLYNENIYQEPRKLELDSSKL